MTNDLVADILGDTIEALEITKKRCEYAHSPDDFLETEIGREKLDSICMKLIAVGESIKKIDRLSNGTLFEKYPDIPWKKVKGIRDFLSHHYFDLDAEMIFSICQKHLNPLIEALKQIRKERFT
ncbi:HepT-like ribonuclease domain-containing protein [Hydrogenimonas sp.]